MFTQRTKQTWSCPDSTVNDVSVGWKLLLKAWRKRISRVSIGSKFARWRKRFGRDSAPDVQKVVPVWARNDLCIINILKVMVLQKTLFPHFLSNHLVIVHFINQSIKGQEVFFLLCDCRLNIHTTFFSVLYLYSHYFCRLCAILVVHTSKCLALLGNGSWPFFSPFSTFQNIHIY